MSSFLNKIIPADFIALVVLIGCFILKGMGADGYVSMTISAIVGYYFGHSVALQIVNVSKKDSADSTDQTE